MRAAIVGRDCARRQAVRAQASMAMDASRSRESQELDAGGAVAKVAPDEPLSSVQGVVVYRERLGSGDRQNVRRGGDRREASSLDGRAAGGTSIVDRDV